MKAKDCGGQVTHHQGRGGAGLIRPHLVGRGVPGWFLRGTREVRTRSGMRGHMRGFVPQDPGVRLVG